MSSEVVSSNNSREVLAPDLRAISDVWWRNATTLELGPDEDFLRRLIDCTVSDGEKNDDQSAIEDLLSERMPSAVRRSYLSFLVTASALLRIGGLTALHGVFESNGDAHTEANAFLVPLDHVDRLIARCTLSAPND